jgi:hypothetical protein
MNVRAVPCSTQVFPPLQAGVDKFTQWYIKKMSA